MSCFIRMLCCIALSFLMTAVVHAEEGVSDRAILIGQTVGLTGTVADPVREMNEGANAYFSKVNKNGGVHGRQIILRTLDDKFDPAITLSNAQALIRNEHVFALFQGRGTPHTEAILPLLAEHGVPLVAPSTGAAIFHEPVRRWVFNIRPKYQDEVAKAIEYFSTLGYKDIALLHVDDAFGLDALAGFNRSMEARQLKPAIIRKFERANPDYGKAAQAVIDARPQTLIIASSAKNTVEVIKAIRARGSQIPILTLSNNSSSAFIKLLGPAGLGIIVSQVMPVPDLALSELAVEFQAAAKASNATLSYAAMEGFVNAKVLVEGLRRAGRELTREKFVRAMETMRRVDIGGIQISYSDKDHSGSAFIELTMIGKDGKFIR